MDQLPVEMQTAILKKLQFVDRLTSKLVCKLWLEIVMGFENQVVFSKCVLSMDRAPVSIFMKSMYQYQCQLFTLDHYNCDIDPNIPNWFWTNNVVINKLGFDYSLFDLVNQIQNINQMYNFVKNIKTIKTFYVHYELIFVLIDIIKDNIQIYQFNEIENMVFDVLASTDRLATKEFKYLFPNLKNIYIRNLYTEIQISLLKFYNIKVKYFHVHQFAFVPNNSYNYCVPEHKYISNINYNKPEEFRVSNLNNLMNPTCARQNEVLTVYSECPIYKWNEHKNVYKIRITVMATCFFHHGNVLTNLSNTKNLEFRLNVKKYCKKCLITLFLNLKNVESLSIEAIFKNNIDFLLKLSSLHFRKLKKLSMQFVSFTNKSLKLFEHVENLFVICCIPYKDQLKNLHQHFPKLKKIEANFEFCHQKQFVDFVRDIVKGNNHLREIISKSRLDNQKTLSSPYILKMCKWLTMYGSKLRVSTFFHFFILIFFLIISLFFFST